MDKDPQYRLPDGYSDPTAVCERCGKTVKVALYVRQGQKVPFVPAHAPSGGRVIGTNTPTRGPARSGSAPSEVVATVHVEAPARPKLREHFWIDYDAAHPCRRGKSCECWASDRFAVCSACRLCFYDAPGECRPTSERYTDGRPISVFPRDEAPIPVQKPSRAEKEDALVE